MELNWTTDKPSEPGAYWVRGYYIGRRNEAALVVVREHGGELCSNLHSTNSDNDDEPTPLVNHNNRFEWCGPLVPATPELSRAVGVGLNEFLDRGGRTKWKHNLVSTMLQQATR